MKSERTVIMSKKIILIFSVLSLSAAQQVWINTKNGILVGKEEKTLAGTTFSSFMGIPYAEPPIGKLRFQPPIPKVPWANKFWDATKERGYCYQVTADSSDEMEDCLYINVYTPAISSTKTLNTSLPVMFFIFGGGFISGYSSRTFFGPELLMNQNVILITFNYRVGPFGFFTTGDTLLPGNAGLKDQLLALKWTNENIHTFGGDPTKITVFGQSAGAASVTYLSINPKANGLYRAAIAESGTFLNPWAFQKKGKELYRKLAASINPIFQNDSISSQELLQYMTSLPAKTIDSASSLMNQQVYPSFVPTLEVEHGNAALTQPMYGLLEMGKFNTVPLLIGFNSEEANFVLDQPGTIEKYAADFDQTSDGLVPVDMNIVDSKNITIVGQVIKNSYVPNSTFTAHIKNCITYFSDQSFARGVLKHANLQSVHAPVYVYRFAYQGVLGGISKTSVPGFSEEVRHGEEIDYVMTRTYSTFKTEDLTRFPQMDRVVQKRMINLFTNFVKYLNPTPEKNELFQHILWQKLEPSTSQYLDIGSDLELKAHPKQKTSSTWDRLYNQYGVPPFITY